MAGRNGGQDSDRRRILDGVIETAKRLDDSALLCQAYVGLGAELSASDDTGVQDQGVEYYREAIDIAETSGIESLAAPARRALRYREELLGLDD